MGGRELSKLAGTLGCRAPWRVLGYASVTALFVLVSLGFAASEASATGTVRATCAYGPCPAATSTVPSATTVAPSDGPQASSSDGSSGLAFTGTDAVTLGAIGALLVVAGGFVLLLSHRRRNTA